MLAKSQQFSDNGVPVRTVTLILTDGGDSGSNAWPAKVANVVKDMLKAEMHIIAALGIDDGSTDFKKVFREMGIPDQWVLTPGNTPTEIRKAFQVFSQSALRVSQNAGQFTAMAANGFFN